MWTKILRTRATRIDALKRRHTDAAERSAFHRAGVRQLGAYADLM
jgi:hypothetical protein